MSRCFIFLGSKGELERRGDYTYPTNNNPTPPTPPHQIPRALPHLPLHIRPILLHEIPVRSPRPVAQSVVLIQRHGIVATPQRPADELGPELEEVLADLAAGAG